MSIRLASCVCCGESGHGTVDHIRPRCMDGSNTPGNRQVLCFRCNNIKARLEARVCVRYRKLINAGRFYQADRVATEFLETWAGYCKQHKHGEWLRCGCNGCLTAPIPFGNEAREAVTR